MHYSKHHRYYIMSTLYYIMSTLHFILQIVPCIMIGSCYMISYFFSLETAGPIQAKFHVESPWDGVTKVCSNVLCHVTKMAAMPIYGENIIKSSTLEPRVWWPCNWIRSIGCLSITPFLQMMKLDLPWPILRQGHFWSLMLLYTTMDFSETVVDYDIKVGRCS